MSVGISNPPVTASPGRQARTTLVVAAMSVFLINLDLFIVNVALPDLQRDLHVRDLADLSWVLNAYTVTFAAMLTPLGRLSDRIGRRRGFTLGILGFTLGSLLCALAPTVGFLVAARAVQALGAALVAPSSLALLLAAYPPERRAGAVRIYGLVGGVAAALGPVVGGVLVDISWHWVFLVNVPIGLATAWLAPRLLDESRDPAARDTVPDVPGALLLAATIGLLVLGLIKGPVWGWTSASVLSSLAGAVVLGLVVTARCRTHPSPVVEPAVLRSPGFVAPTVALLLWSAAFGALILGGIELLSAVHPQWSAVRLGAAMAPGPLATLPMALVAARLSTRLRGAAIASIGCVVLAGGALLLVLTADSHHSYAAGFLPGLLVTGLGVGLSLPALLSSATSGLAAHRYATGSAVVNTARQVGAALGVAGLVAAIGHPTTRAGLDAAAQRGWWLVVIASLAAGALVLRQRRPA